MPRRKRIAPSISRIRSAITNGSSVLANVDHRSAMMRRLKDLISAHESDLGGEDYVSESERRIVRRAAMLTIQLEMLDAKFAANEGGSHLAQLHMYQTASNCLRRLLQTLGLQRSAEGRLVTDARSVPARQTHGGGGMIERRRLRCDTRSFSILDCINDDALFGRFFRACTWDAWRVFLGVLFGLPLSERQLDIYRKHTGRQTPPTSLLHEAWLVVGRRGGKSFVLALIAVFMATFKDWRPFLGPGEIGTLMVVCQDRRQARTIMRDYPGLAQSSADAGGVDRRPHPRKHHLNQPDRDRSSHCIISINQRLQHCLRLG